MMIEVYNEKDSIKIAELGYKLIYTRKNDKGVIFVFNYENRLKYELGDIKFNLTNKIYF